MNTSFNLLVTELFDHERVKVKRSCYSPSEVSSALHAILKGMSVSKASQTLGVPRSTTRHKTAGRAPESSRHFGP